MAEMTPQGWPLFAVTRTPGAEGASARDHVAIYAVIGWQETSAIDPRGFAYRVPILAELNGKAIAQVWTAQWEGAIRLFAQLADARRAMEWALAGESW